MEASQEEIDAFEAFLYKVSNKPADLKGDGDERLKKWLGDTIQDLQEKKEARQMSAAWYSAQ